MRITLSHFFLLLILGCSSSQNSSSPLSPPYSPFAPQPAAKYCTDLGYSLNNDLCVFPDQTSCPEWEFFYGTCGQQFSYCEKNGFTLQTRTDNMGTWTAIYAVCVFNDTSECLERDYLSGTCVPSQ
ncbi:MAG TPA: hypothetical protein VEJ22_06780, partial [Nitrospirota bacterium]|nr:hypothetical protein [Nitrospirota bacterium]